MPNPKPSEVVSATSAPAYRAALDAQRAELMAMPEQEVERKLTLDASAAAIIAESAAKKVQPYRAELVAQFGKDAGTLVDTLPNLARATRQADIEVAGTASRSDLSEENEVLRGEYQLLMTDSESLANRKLLDAKRLEPARDVQGYQALIRSVLLLVFVLREHWAQIKSHTPITEADLDRAEATAQRMSTALGDRDIGVGRAPAVELRSRAISKLTRTYEELRRMMTYVRWYQDDVDEITPSLWAMRSRKSRSANDGSNGTDNPAIDPTVDADAPPPPATPSPNNGGSPFAG